MLSITIFFPLVRAVCQKCKHLDWAIQRGFPLYVGFRSMLSSTPQGMDCEIAMRQVFVFSTGPRVNKVFTFAGGARFD